MNKTTCKKLNSLRDKIDSLNVDLEAIKDEEQDFFDEKSENWQNSDAGDLLTEIIDSLDNSNSLLNDVISSLEETITLAEA